MQGGDLLHFCFVVLILPSLNFDPNRNSSSSHLRLTDCAAAAAVPARGEGLPGLRVRAGHGARLVARLHLLGHVAARRGRAPQRRQPPGARQLSPQQRAFIIVNPVDNHHIEKQHIVGGTVQS